MHPNFTTVAEAVAQVHRYFPDNDLTFQDAQGAETRYSYVEVEAATATRAAALQELGLQAGDRVGLVVMEPEDFVLTFLGALRVGVIPVPMYPPMSFGSVDAWSERTGRILAVSGAKLLVASRRVIDALGDRPVPAPVVAADALRVAFGAPVYPEITPSDVAFLQFTSGSTADPKGVIVTHGSLVANSRGIITEGLQLDASRGDRGVSWLPLYHDMGLIGFVIAPICHGVSIVYIPTMRFIKRPSAWLETVHRHRGAATFAPNFAFALATRRVSEEELARWDLSCLRVVGCGAEPIHPDTMRRFEERLAPCGLLPSAIMPAYGMAEATLAISLKPAPERMQTLVVDAEAFQATGEVRADADAALTAEYVACGVPFRGHEVSVADPETGVHLGENQQGELIFRGPSVTAGYWNNPEATAASWRDGWLHTGDLGFVRDGQIYVTGRLKDLIIINGRNVHPQAVEWAAAVEGVRENHVVAFSVPGEPSERLVVVLETKEQDHAPLKAAVAARVQAELGLAVSEVVCLPSGGLTKTSSGKLQRRKTVTRYLAGELHAPAPRRVRPVEAAPPPAK
jgi:fatty-acyl-CoA synthase